MICFGPIDVLRLPYSIPDNFLPSRVDGAQLIETFSAFWSGEGPVKLH